MWVKHLADGTRILEGNKPGQTWMTTPIDSIIRVDLIVPQHIFGNEHRFSLRGPGPYHQAVKARASIGGNAIKIAEYIQRFDGKGWLTIEANYSIGKVKQYILPKRLGA